MLNRPLPALPGDVALLIGRTVLGIVLFAHGWQKLMINGISATYGQFEKMGIPLAIVSASFTSFVEFVGGVLLILGALTTTVIALDLVVMLGAAGFVHVTHGIFAQDGGWELVGVIVAAELAIAARGPGRFSVDGWIASRRTRDDQRVRVSLSEARKANADRRADGAATGGSVADRFVPAWRGGAVETARDWTPGSWDVEPDDAPDTAARSAAGEGPMPAGRPRAAVTRETGPQAMARPDRQPGPRNVAQSGPQRAVRTGPQAVAGTGPQGGMPSGPQRVQQPGPQDAAPAGPRGAGAADGTHARRPGPAQAGQRGVLVPGSPSGAPGGPLPVRSRAGRPAAGEAPATGALPAVRAAGPAGAGADRAVADDGPRWLAEPPVEPLTGGNAWLAAPSAAPAAGPRPPAPRAVPPAPVSGGSLFASAAPPVADGAGEEDEPRARAARAYVPMPTAAPGQACPVTTAETAATAASLVGPAGGADGTQPPVSQPPAAEPGTPEPAVPGAREAGPRVPASSGAGDQPAGDLPGGLSAAVRRTLARRSAPRTAPPPPFGVEAVTPLDFSPTGAIPVTRPPLAAAASADYQPTPTEALPVTPPPGTPALPRRTQPRAAAGPRA